MRTCVPSAERERFETEAEDRRAENDRLNAGTVILSKSPAHLHGLSLDFAVLSAERELFEQEVEARDYRLSVSLQSAVCSQCQL